MVNQQIVDYINNNKDKFSIEALKANLIKQGYSIIEVKEAVNIATSSSDVSSTKFPEGKPKKKKVFLILITALLVLIIGGAIFFLIRSPGQKISLYEGENSSFTVAGTTHTITADEVTDNSATVTIASSPQTITLMIGESDEITLEGKNIAITLDKIEEGKAFFSIKEIKEVEESGNAITGKASLEKKCGMLEGKFQIECMAEQAIASKDYHACYEISNEEDNWQDECFMKILKDIKDVPITLSWTALALASKDAKWCEYEDFNFKEDCKLKLELAKNLPSYCGDMCKSHCEAIINADEQCYEDCMTSCDESIAFLKKVSAVGDIPTTLAETGGEVMGMETSSFMPLHEFVAFYKNDPKFCEGIHNIPDSEIINTFCKNKYGYENRMEECATLARAELLRDCYIPPIIASGGDFEDCQSLAGLLTSEYGIISSFVKIYYPSTSPYDDCVYNIALIKTVFGKTIDCSKLQGSAVESCYKSWFVPENIDECIQTCEKAPKYLSEAYEEAESSIEVCNDKCYKNFALLKEDVSICEKITDGITKNDCYTGMAVLLDNPSLCKKMGLSEERIQQIEQEEDEYFAKQIEASEQKDAEKSCYSMVCETRYAPIKDENDSKKVDACVLDLSKDYRAAAIETGDASLCGRYTNVTERDSCYSDMAEGNASLCENVQDSKTKDECYSYSIYNGLSKDPAICGKIGGSEEKFSCYQSLCEQYSNEEACNSLEASKESFATESAALKEKVTGLCISALCKNKPEGFEGSCTGMDEQYCYSLCEDQEEPYKLYCYIESEADYSRDSSLCDKIAGLDYRDDCYFNIARTMGDSSLCDKIAGLDYRDDCYFNTAEWIEDPSICGKIADSEYKNNCDLVLDAITSKNPSLCEKITDSTNRDWCYIDMVSIMEDSSLCEKVVDPDFKESCYL